MLGLDSRFAHVLSCLCMSLFCAAPPARHCSRRQSLLLLLLLRPLSSFGPTTSRPFFPSFLPSLPPHPSILPFLPFPPLALIPFLPLLSCRIPVSIPTSSIIAGYQSPGRVQSAKVLALGIFGSRGLASCSVVVSASVSDSVGCLAQSHALILGPIYSPSPRLARRLLASTTHAFSRRFPGSLLPRPFSPSFHFHQRPSTNPPGVTSPYPVSRNRRRRVRSSATTVAIAHSPVPASPPLAAATTTSHLRLPQHAQGIASDRFHLPPSRSLSSEPPMRG